MSAIDNPEPALQVAGSAGPNACWSCGDMRAAHFCESCGKLQPATPTDFFSFFGLPRKLNIDIHALEQEFYKLSRKLHPDVHARANQQEQRWSLEKSSQLNDAYRTLREPIARTEYLLNLEGVQLEEQSKAATEKARQSGEQKKQVVPPELLEEVFELNMQLEEARMSRKMGEQDASITEELRATKNSLEAKYQALDNELHGYWADWDRLISMPGCVKSRDMWAVQRKAMLDSMLGLLNRRSYIRNLLRDVNEVLQ
ncbi:MAG: Fe-S protein assembly co-chaperone HscB [Terriglobales bacterium]